MNEVKVSGYVVYKADLESLPGSPNYFPNEIVLNNIEKYIPASKLNELKLEIANLKQIKKIHYDSTTPMDTYHTGMYNGIEVVLSLIEKRAPEFLAVEKQNV